MKKNRISIFIGMIFLVFISVFTTLMFSSLGNYILTGSVNGFSKEDMVFVQKILASKKVISEKYLKEVSDEILYDGAMAGMLSAVNDPYTEYLPEEANKALEETTTGKYEGVGIIVTKMPDSKFPQILYVLPNTPAEEVGLKPNDKILFINKNTCEDIDLTKAVELMKVKAGNDITLKIEREKKEIEIKLTTKEIKINSVYSENMNGIGYIQIAEFGENTANEFETEYKKLRDENISGLIIDLRDNGGGIYEEVVKIAKTIIPKGLIVYTEDKNGVKKEENATGNGIDIPLVVLINENSASASEILAGAVKDRNVGTLVGEKSFGKGLVQGWFMIGDGTSIKVTIAKYFTPSGVCIEGTGITPDIEIKNNNYLKDIQLNKALELLKK